MDTERRNKNKERNYVQLPFFAKKEGIVTIEFLHEKRIKRGKKRGSSPIWGPGPPKFDK